MKISKFFAAVFGLLGLCAAAAGIYLALENRNADPVLVEEPQAAKAQVGAMLDALCQGDYDGVSAALYGTPSLGIDSQPESQVGALIWDAFAGSFRYELRGDLYVTGDGVAQDVTITALEMSSVTDTLRDRSQALLEQRVREAEDTSDIYDENYEYREEFVMAVLLDAAKQAIEQDSRTVSRELTLNLVYENGQWWIKPESGLLEAISGGILK